MSCWIDLSACSATGMHVRVYPADTVRVHKRSERALSSSCCEWLCTMPRTASLCAIEEVLNVKTVKQTLFSYRVHIIFASLNRLKRKY
jgi:hypothetical protein